MDGCVMDTAVSASGGPVAPVPVARVCADLLELFGGVSDARSDQADFAGCPPRPSGVVLRRRGLGTGQPANT